MDYAPLTSKLGAYLEGLPPGDDGAWLTDKRGDPIDFQPDPTSPAKRLFIAEEWYNSACDWFNNAIWQAVHNSAQHPEDPPPPPGVGDDILGAPFIP